MTPHDLAAEQSVLGGILLRPERLDEVIDLLSAEDFYDARHGVLFGSLCEMSSGRVQIDPATLIAHLRASGALEDAGGAGAVTGLLDAVPTAANLTGHATIVRDLSRIRRTGTAALDIYQRAMGGHYGDATEFCDAAEAQIMQATETKAVADAVPMKSVVRETRDWLQELASNRVTAFGVTTGVSEMDDWTCGLQPGDLVIIAAPPSTGKTALATWLAIGADQPSALFSLEQSRQQIALRLFAGETGIPAYQLRSPRFWPTDGVDRIVSAAGRLSKCAMYVDDRSGLSPSQVSSRCRRLKRSVGLGLAVIDYLQICRPSRYRKGQSRERDVADMTAEFKELAKSLHIPVVVLSQLSRGYKDSADKRPQLYHLRESGAIEQDADVVMFIHRPNRSTDSAPNTPEDAELILAKNRNGPTGTVHVTWDPVRMRFTDPRNGPSVPDVADETDERLRAVCGEQPF